MILAAATPRVIPMTLESEDQRDFLSTFLLIGLFGKSVIPFLDKLDKLRIAVLEAVLDIQSNNGGGLPESLKLLFQDLFLVFGHADHFVGPFQENPVHRNESESLFQTSGTGVEVVRVLRQNNCRGWRPEKSSGAYAKDSLILPLILISGIRQAVHQIFTHGFSSLSVWNQK